MLLATWNLENLFRPGSRYGPDDERTYRAKVAALGARIADVAPDVLAVQEVGDPVALDDVLKAAGGRWQVVLSEFPDERGIRVGLASRSRLADVTQVRAFPEPVAPVQADDSGTTIAAMGRGELIDHILVSQSLVRAVVRVDTVGEPPSIGDDPELRFDEPASDHARLLAEFDV